MQPISWVDILFLIPGVILVWVIVGFVIYAFYKLMRD